MSEGHESSTERYDAFISYRHTESDRRWATWLLESLEKYRVPKALVEQGFPARITRVFRDEDELPTSANLADNIQEALEASAFLIVICSRDTPESQWVNEEVLTFRRLGRHDRILALLVDGEPRDSFPEALGQIRTSEEGPDGELVEVVKDVEPLAADVRPRAGESNRALKDKALLRIASTIIGCRYDDLRQRHQRRARRERISKSLIACVVLGALIVGALPLLEPPRKPPWCKKDLSKYSTNAQMVCKTDTLWGLDRENVDLYFNLRNRLKNAGDTAALKREKTALKQWLKERKACADDVECTRKSYQGRISALQASTQALP